MENKFDFIDDQWPFTGVKEKRHVVRAVLLDENNNVCLEKIDDDDMFGHRDYYETPGGGVKEGESFSEALNRETSEELGWNCEIISPLGEVHDFYNLIQRENFNHFYLARRTKKVEQHLEPDERTRISKIIWVPIDEAIKLYQGMQNELVGKLVKQRELPILMIAKNKIDLL